MAWFIWNNTDSRYMRGLRVTSLPPIILPAKRVEKTEIDGRDGDIITEQGYSAYDEDIGIGITSELLRDVYAITAWLRGEGELIKSTEPDMVYRAQIINQISYERLLRWKTAKITFHVQPYKYLRDEPHVIQSFAVSGGSLPVVNAGDADALPVIEMTGSGTVVMTLNGVEAFTYTFPGADTTVTIDSEQEDAYAGAVLKNRSMTGDFPEFVPGNNVLSWTGNITKLDIQVNSRWI